MSKMEILSNNLLNTSTLIGVSTGSSTVKYLFDRNIDTYYESYISTTININFGTLTAFSRIALQNHDFLKFNLYYNNSTSNTITLSNCDTSSADWINNSTTNSYLKFNTINASSLQLHIDLSQNSVYDLGYTFSSISITPLNSNTIAYIDNRYLLKTISYNTNSGWHQIGNDYTISTSYQPIITALNSITIALLQPLYTIKTLIWNGTNWTITGNAYTLTAQTMSATDATTLDATNTIAMLTNTRLNTMYWNGTNWTITGNDLNAYTHISKANFSYSGAKWTNSVGIIDSLKRIYWAQWLVTTSTWNFYGTPLTVGADLTNVKITSADTNTIAILKPLSDIVDFYNNVTGTTWTLSSSYNVTSLTVGDIKCMEYPDFILANNGTQRLTLNKHDSGFIDQNIYPIKLSELWINDLKFQFENNPNYKNYKPRKNVIELNHEMANGGYSKYTFGDRYETKIKLEYQSRNMYNKFYDLYNNNDSFVFVSFPTSTNWEGNNIYNVNWVGDFISMKLTENNWQTNGYILEMDIKETPK
jgi:hypothetical protein